MTKEKKLLEEFKEAAAFHRLQNAILLGQTTIFLAANAGLLSAFVQDHPPAGWFGSVLKIGGVMISLVIWTVSDRAYQYSHAARKLAGDIGEKLGFQIYKHWEIPSSRFIPATMAIKGLYIIAALGWLIFLVVPMCLHKFP